ncbi:MAG TPA: type II toxin-antitoxin system VapC family toxin [Streptosporangiaceae bacterium]|nr:type II toxin-antitoxin system VapC family toxin [Streptosporangiaceae bacterium]
MRRGTSESPREPRHPSPWPPLAAPACVPPASSRRSCQPTVAGWARPLPISIAHAIAAGRLPRHHDDPFDRMLIAQAFAEGLTVVTHDKRFTDYHVPTLPT